MRMVSGRLKYHRYTIFHIIINLLWYKKHHKKYSIGNSFGDSSGNCREEPNRKTTESENRRLVFCEGIDQEI